MTYWKQILSNNLEQVEKHYCTKVNVELLKESEARRLYLNWLGELEKTQETK